MLGDEERDPEYLLVVDLTGAQLRELLANHEPVVSGVKFTFKEGKDRELLEVVDAAGKPIPAVARIKVVINDFMYRGGDHYRFQSYDAEPEETAPVLRMLREMGRANKKLDVNADERLSARDGALRARSTSPSARRARR